MSIRQKIFPALNRLEEYLIGAGLLLTIFIIFINVILRYVFKSNTTWAEEMVRYLMIWITFIGSSVCIRYGAHVSVDFILPFISPRSRWFLAFIVNIIGLVFSITLFKYSWEAVIQLKISGQVSPALGVPMAYVYLSVLTGSLLMALRYSQEIIELYKAEHVINLEDERENAKLIDEPKQERS